jgi:hypothetical protein
MAGTATYRRKRINTSGNWTAWERVYIGEAELDARYLNASNLNAGTVPDARLPLQLRGEYVLTNDANDATKPGIYLLANASQAANEPPGTDAYAYLRVMALSTGTYVYQEWIPWLDAQVDLYGRWWRVKQDAAGWTAWRSYNAESDARYVSATGDETVAGSKTFSSEIIGPATGNVLRVGDDSRLADVNVVDTMGVVSTTTPNNGGIQFGSTAGNFRINGVGTAGTAKGSLTITGETTVQGFRINLAPSSAVAAGFEIGHRGGTATTPFIDFHSGAVDVDFDARIVAGGGTGVTGGGDLTYTANGGHYFEGVITGNGSGLTSLNASNLGSGTVPDARMPSRLQPSASTITDWNSATANGWYKGQNAANSPDADTGSWWFGQVITHSGTDLLQNVYKYIGTGSGLTTMVTFSRWKISGTWGSWLRLHVSEAELDARYAQKANNLSDLTSVSTARANLQLAASVQRVYYTTVVPARPTGATYVEWVGQTDPAANATAGDTWVSTA